MKNLRSYNLIKIENVNAIIGRPTQCPGNFLANKTRQIHLTKLNYCVLWLCLFWAILLCIIRTTTIVIIFSLLYFHHKIKHINYVELVTLIFPRTVTDTWLQDTLIFIRNGSFRFSTTFIRYIIFNRFQLAQ